MKTSLILLLLLGRALAQNPLDQEFEDLLQEAPELQALEQNSMPGEESAPAAEVGLEAELEEEVQALDQQLNSAPQVDKQSSALEEKAELDELLSEEATVNVQGADTSLDELEQIKQDLRDDFGDLEFKEVARPAPVPTESGQKTAANASSKVEVNTFDVGQEAKKLIEIAKYVENKIPEKRWKEIAGETIEEKYVVQEGEWLWKISERLFGSGFYYSKIWSLNPFITNPHEIKPGMVLLFNTGSELDLPTIKVGSFSGDRSEMAQNLNEGGGTDLSYFGDEIEADWLKERERLIKEGVFVQFASEYTYEDLIEREKRTLIDEYKRYDPPEPPLQITLPDDGEYDRLGFDRNSKVSFDFKEGFFLNSFITTNYVQDIGALEFSKNETVYLMQGAKVYLKINDGIQVAPGDRYSIYKFEGKIGHPKSDRSGYRYTTIGNVKVLRPVGESWEAEIEEVSGVIERDDRLTIHIPKIGKILRTFNKRKIEAIVVDSYIDRSLISHGDVVYLDRGRVDGVELGNIFELYDSEDRVKEQTISTMPAYKIAEIVVISLSDNFSTALVTVGVKDFSLGQLAVSKDLTKAAMAMKVKNKTLLQGIEKREKQAQNDLDIELNLDNLNKDLLDQAQKIELTDDEIEELQRKEREKSQMTEEERDLNKLSQLENEIEGAELLLNEAKMDEDRFLEEQSLDAMEKDYEKPSVNAFESLDEIEREEGRKYMDQDLNGKENPFGLTENDLEEIDDLLKSENNTNDVK